jgi:L-rhamnose mutarotase
MTTEIETCVICKKHVESWGIVINTNVNEYTRIHKECYDELYAQERARNENN